MNSSRNSKPSKETRRAELTLQLLLLTGVLLSGCLCWMSYQLGDRFATGCFGLLQIALVLCDRVLVGAWGDEVPSNVVDIETRRRQLATIAAPDYQPSRTRVQ